MSSEAQPTSLICKTCNAANPFGIVLCVNCRAVFDQKVVLPDEDSSAPVTEPIAANNADEAMSLSRLTVIEFRGEKIPEGANMSAAIPVERLINKQTIRIGRRHRPHPNHEPHMDFGFLFYFWPEKKSFPISRKAALLFGHHGKIELRRTGNSGIHLRKPGETKNKPIPQGQIVKIEDGDIIIFGNPGNVFKVKVHISDELLSKLD